MSDNRLTRPCVVHSLLRKCYGKPARVSVKKSNETAAESSKSDRVHNSLGVSGAQVRTWLRLDQQFRKSPTLLGEHVASACILTYAFHAYAHTEMQYSRAYLSAHAALASEFRDAGLPQVAASLTPSQ